MISERPTEVDDRDVSNKATLVYAPWAVWACMVLAPELLTNADVVLVPGGA